MYSNGKESKPKSDAITGWMFHRHWEIVVMSTEGMAIRNNEKALFRSAEELRVSSTKDRAIELGKRTGAKPSKQSKTRADILCYTHSATHRGASVAHISRDMATLTPPPLVPNSLCGKVYISLFSYHSWDGNSDLYARNGSQTIYSEMSKLSIVDFIVIYYFTQVIKDTYRNHNNEYLF